MKLTKTHVLLGAGLIALSTYGFAAPTTGQAGDHQVVVTGTGLSDAQIRAEVRQRINERSELRFFNIDVQSFHHDVYLYGLVDTGADSAEAEAIARSVPSVGKVYNSLAVNND
jgi:osmotically-inducible protein OsmY